MIMNEDEYLAHYGVLRKSGRYPWGSGKTSVARSQMFLDSVNELHKQGLTPVQIVAGLGLDSTTQLRATKSIAKNEIKQSNINQARRLKDKGLSNGEIGKKMGGLNESSVRALLADGVKEKADMLMSTATMLKSQVEQKGLVDVGKGVSHQVGVSKGMLDNAIAVLKEDGYEVHTIGVEQLGTGQKTNVKVLAPPGTTWSDVRAGQSNIKQITDVSDDHGRSFSDLGVIAPLSISQKRVGIVYAEDGGSKADGVIYIRPGVKDVEIGASSYAQVRVQVGPKHYLKGMALYKDDLPEGIDIQFNTNKSNTGKKLDAMKELKTNADGSIDMDNPFGANIKRQIFVKDSKGNKKTTSVMNIVNEEADWSRWSRTLSSQMLSKQSPTLVKNQLELTTKQRQEEFDRLSSLTNPTVKKRLLEDFGDGVDSVAVSLAAASIPRTHGHHVILPISKIAPTQIYAPNYKDGEKVVLIRHPHGGTFEIPELVVNNKNPEARRLLKDAKDAVGIHHTVAERLSGADFDGDTVLVIPNNTGRVKTTAALDDLRNFDPQREYPAYPGMKPMSSSTKQKQMGDVSNLIADMTIKGASTGELARAVRHSMVVIDAEKHNLDYKGSASHNGIAQLKEKYQGSKRAGAATLISKAGAETRIPERKPRAQSRGGPIDKATGKRVYEETGAGYPGKNGDFILRTDKVDRLSVTNDARTLSSGTRIESIYADHSNKLKTMANAARKESVKIPNLKYSQSAAKTYRNEVESLTARLKIAERNAPLERQAQIIANNTYKAKLDAHPDMDDATKKKVKFQALAAARARMGAGKEKIEITQEEWNAIQAGAITHSKLNAILDNANMETVKKLATPRAQRLMTSAKTSQAKKMLANGYTRAEVASRLGVSLSTLDEAVL